LLAAWLVALRLASLRPLLVVQFVLLAGFLALNVSAGPRIDPDGSSGVLAGMLGVSAMAVQNALVQPSVRDAPSTAVMTTNITRPAIVGFAAGAGLGAALFMIAGYAFNGQMSIHQEGEER
jgi:uncharacterized membrane protein YoaK (UPF0700 family)